MRVLDPLFLNTNHCVGLLFTYKVSDVVIGAKSFALEVTMKF